LEDNDKKHDPPPPPPKYKKKATASANTPKTSPDKSAKATKAQSNTPVFVDQDGGTHTYAPPGSGLHGKDTILNAETSDGALSHQVIAFDKGGHPETNSAGYLVSNTSLLDKNKVPLNAETVPYIALPGKHFQGANFGDMVTITSQKLNKNNQPVGEPIMKNMPYGDSRGSRENGYEISTAGLSALHIPTALNKFGHTEVVGRQHVEIQVHPGSGPKSGRYEGSNPQ
jgi:hypothetical protein